MTEVMLVEDDICFAERFAEAVERSDSMRLAAHCTTARDALERLKVLAPDVLLVDLGLPDGNCIDVIRSAVERYPGCDVLVVTMYGDQTNVLTCIEAGASGYLLKEAVKEDIVKHIDDLRSGGSPISPVIARQLLRKFQPVRPSEPAAAAQPEHVTERELQVLQLLAEGRPAEGQARLHAGTDLARVGRCVLAIAALEGLTGERFRQRPFVQVLGRAPQQPLAAPGIEIGEVGVEAKAPAAGLAAAALVAVIQHGLAQVGAAVGIDAGHDAHLQRRAAMRAGKGLGMQA